MSDSPLTADDPRLTAYALGELDAADRPAVEAALGADPALRATVAEIRRCAAALESALAAEAAATGTVPAAAEARVPPTYRVEPPRRRWVAFPQFYYLVGGLAAAGFALLVALDRDSIIEKEQARERQRQAEEGGRRKYFGFGSYSIDVAKPLVPAAPQAERREGLLLTPDYGDAALAAVRQALADGRLPPAATVRTAELVNAFRYRTPSAPVRPEAEPVAAALETGDSPWAPGRQLVRMGFRAREQTLEAVRETILSGMARPPAAAARDLRIQVEFNPARVAGFRLIGRDDTLASPGAHPDELATAPQFGAGQAFTALYEIMPAASPARSERADGSLLTVRLEFADAADGARRAQEFALADRGAAGERLAPSEDFRFAARVAEFALALARPSEPERANALRALTAREAATPAGEAGEPDRQRAELAELVRRAQSLLE